MIRIALYAVASSSLFAQSIGLHVTATTQPPAAVKTAFGRLGNYIVVSTDICLNQPVTVKIATARLRQAFTMPAGYTLLSSQVAAEVIQEAQGKAPLAMTARILGGASSAAGAAVAVKAVPASGWGSGVILAGEGLSILLQYIFPAISTHAVVNATHLLPEMLEFDTASGACVSGPVLVSGPKNPKLGILDESVSVVVQ